MARPLARSALPLLLVAALGACPERKAGEPRAAVVATVHGAAVTADQFQEELAFARRTSAGVLPQTEEEVLAFRKAALEGFIDRMLVAAAAHEAGVQVAWDKVDREVLRLKADYHGKGFNEALAEGQISQQELRERTRARLIYERYFVDVVFSRVAVTDAEIEAYYQERAEEFRIPEQVRAAQIVVKTTGEARRIATRIRDGMSFDEAARRWSLSPDAKVGGDLGFFKRGTMPAIFDQTCFALSAGKVSDVVASDFGFHLFKVLDRRASELRPLARARGDIERALLQRKREEAQRRALLELRAGAEAAAACKRSDAGVASEEALGECLRAAAAERIQIHEAVLAQLPP